MADGAQAEPKPHPAPRLSLTSVHPGRVLWPWQVQLHDWKRIIKKMIKEISDDRLTMVAGALAFYAMLALFPGLIALVSLFGLIADPKEIEAGLSELTDLLPDTASDLLRTQLHDLVNTPSTSLSIGLLVSVLTALWSASSGVDALVDSINVAYNKVEKRNWFKRRAMSLLMTLVLIVLTFVIIGLVAVLPSINLWLGDRVIVLGLLSALRWPVLAAVVALGLFCLYRFAPCRKRPSTSDMSGALIATVLFLVASSLFSLYVSEFASYHKTYGAVGSVVALLFWFYYSSLIILLGAELSAEFEGEKERELPRS
ncbi:MAG: Ribonuclease [Myxococcaceae bacterium]|nr:Ribonuclease [Myxococcaceae bacterium]